MGRGFRLVEGQRFIELVRHFQLGFVQHVGINLGGFCLGVAEVFLHLLQGAFVVDQQARGAVPLRYNKNKSEKPRSEKGFRGFRLCFSSFSK